MTTAISHGLTRMITDMGGAGVAVLPVGRGVTTACAFFLDFLSVSIRVNPWLSRSLGLEEQA